MIATLNAIRHTREKRELLFTDFGLLRSSDWHKTHSLLADELISAIYEVHRSQSNDAQVALVATGGYGRNEVAPHSDLDIAFVPLNEANPEVESFVRVLFRAIIDAFAKLDWQVGYAYRLRSDLPALDSTSRSSLIDARLICGSQESFNLLMGHFWDTFPTAEFLIDKMTEREEFHKRWLNTEHLAEPHLRDGVGGLRDFQTALWMTKSLGKHADGPAQDEYEWLLKVRDALHLSAKRKQDQLVRARKAEVADVLQIAPEELEARTYGAFERILSVFIQSKREAKQSSMPLAPAVEARDGWCIVSESATVSNAALGVARAAKLGLRLSPCRALRPADDYPRLTQLITESERTLRAFEESQLLLRILPEMADCFRQAPPDPVHTFTVGEHSLRLIRNLDESKSNPSFGEVWDEIHDARPLYLAGLLHDVGKSDPTARHEIVGAQIAEKVCRRLEVSADETDAAVWLVKNHLLMAQIARTHDIAHPQTPAQLARVCERADRMAMLYLLTYADTAAVSDHTWTPHVASSLAELYSRARSFIESAQPILDPAQYRTQGVNRLKAAGRQNQDVETLLQSMPTHYLLSTPVELFPDHANMVRLAQEGEISVLFQHRFETQQTELTVSMPDLPEPGLLSHILGILYAHDVSVHSVRVASTVGARSIALDVLTVSYHGRMLPAGLCAILASDIKNKASSQEATRDLLLALGKDPDRTQAMFTHTFQEGSPGVLEIETPPGRGMPYRVSKMLADFGWNIEVARIGLWAGRAVARFYVGLPNRIALDSETVEKRFSNRRR